RCFADLLGLGSETGQNHPAARFVERRADRQAPSITVHHWLHVRACFARMPYARGRRRDPGRMGGAPRYLRWTNFPLHEGHRSEVEASLSPFHQVIASQPGFCRALLAFDAAATHFVSATVWTTHAEAEAITRTVRDGAQRELGDLLRGEPTT